MKLKTLKDLNEVDFKGEIEGKVLLISKEKLKAEAIKWVKEFETRDYIGLFMDFFNISEEDLK